MAYIDESLSSGEQIEHLFKLHWFSWVPFWLYVVIGPFTLGILWIVAIYEFFRLRNIEQGVTNKRVIAKHGIISRKSDEMKVSSIETVEIEQSAWGRIFGYGTIKVTGRGISDVVFKKIDDPMAVKRAIESVGHPAQ